MSQGDPTDHALAAIASILDHPQSRDADRPAVEQGPPLAPGEPDTYAKIGPGPMAAIRFKWSIRRADDGDYYVDETIGESSVPAVSGPMTRDAAIRMVDDREYEARRRYEELRSEMAGRSMAALMSRQEAGEG